MDYVPVSVNLDCVHNANNHTYDQFPGIMESSLVIRVDKMGIPVARNRKTNEVIPLAKINDKKIYLVSKITAKKLGTIIPTVFTDHRSYSLYSYHPNIVEAIQTPTRKDSRKLAYMRKVAQMRAVNESGWVMSPQ